MRPRRRAGVFLRPYLNTYVYMMQLNKQHKRPNPKPTGPIRIGSPLYRLLEIIADRVAMRLRSKRE
jgi:hypothetical protein